MSALCVATSVLIAACGGGEPEPQATSLEQAPFSARTLALPTAQAMQTLETQAAIGSDWSLCAAENGYCAFSGLRTVQYGDATHLVSKPMLGGTRCGNDVFGDPIPGVVKSCWLEAVFVPPANAQWDPCASENGSCGFSGAGPVQVRYGAGDNFTTRALTSPVACNNATFGDPAPGVVKACATLVSATPAPVPVDTCEAVPALPTLPADHNLVTAFCVDGRCARPDDDVDDTDAIDAALSQSAGKFLVFPPGRYLIKRSLRVKRAGVTLWGPGATIHATNPDDQSIIVEANDTSIYSFRLTAVTTQRGSRAEHTRIAIYGPASVNPVVTNTVIRNNEIVNAGNPGTPLANAATGAGIFVNRADGFLIAGNTVARTLADGIHVTGGARNGRVLDNTVRETGDDMIAIVSYAYPDPWANTAATIVPNFAANQATWQDRNILVAGNRLSGQYWGRGIAVVGGRDITIRSNTLSNIPYAAAVLLARETSSGTYGLDNVRVEKNSIREVQTLNPPYDFNNTFSSHGRTGHGAIEVHGSMFVDELSVAALVAGLTVGNLAILDNTITSTATPGVRIGVGTGSTGMMGTRPITGNAPLRNIVVSGNVMSDIRNNQPLQLLAGSGVAACMGNLLGGAAVTAANCAAAPTAPVATGAALSCSGSSTRGSRKL